MLLELTLLGVVLVLWIIKRLLRVSWSTLLLAIMMLVAFVPRLLTPELRGDSIGYSILNAASELLLRPWLTPGQVLHSVSGWFWLPVLLGVGQAAVRRLQWLSYRYSMLATLLLLGWLSAAYLSGGSLNFLHEASVQVVQLTPELKAELGNWRWALWSIWGLCMLLIEGLPLFLFGVLVGAVAVILPVAFMRASGCGAGFYSRQFAFRYLRGGDAVVVRYRANRSGRFQIARVPLSRFGFTDKEESLTSTVYVPKTISVHVTPGPYVSTATAQEYGGYSYDRTVKTSVRLVSIRGIPIFDMRVAPGVTAEARRAAQLIDKRYAAPFCATEKMRREREEKLCADETKQREATAVEEAKQHAAVTLRSLLDEAGIDLSHGNHWCESRHDASGGLIEVLAADRNGNGVVWYENGKMRWQGSWTHAQVLVDRPNLELVVDDEAYSIKHMCDRRIRIAETWSQALRDEWVSRIRILSAMAGPV